MNHPIVSETVATTRGSVSGGVIRFYGAKDAYYVLSNYYPDAGFQLDGRAWHSSEQYYQACKFRLGSKEYEEIFQAKTPAACKRLAWAKKRSTEVRPDWDRVKDEVMLRALRAKFHQNAVLGRMLLRTGEAELREHTEKDFYWGDGGKLAGGLNKLGLLLMQLRDELRAQLPVPTPAVD